MKNYFFFSPSHDAPQNMAYDDFFLDRIEADDFLLMFYINDNAVIIGKNQNGWKECNLEAMEADGVTLARRVSGGGAVYHDMKNLNFSFIAGSKRYDVEKQLSLIVDTLQNMGIPAVFSGRNDILADGKKFSGNAFCRRKNILMHHGTLMIDSDLSKLPKYLNVSPLKIKSKGVESVRSRVCKLTDFLPTLTIAQLTEVILDVFEKNYGAYETFFFTPEEEQTLKALYEKHSAWQWRLGTTPKFDIQLETRFAWGGVDLYLAVEKGIVKEATIFTDSLDIDLAEALSAALTGVPFRSAALAAAVRSRLKNQAGEDLASFFEAQSL